MTNRLPFCGRPGRLAAEPGRAFGDAIILRGILNLSSHPAQERAAIRPLQTTDNQLRPAEVVCIGFLTILSLLNVVFASRIAHWWLLISINVAIAALILALARAESRTGSRVLGFMRDWYVLPLIFVAFKEVYFMIPPIHQGQDYDALLIWLDRCVFGMNPTEWANQFANPFLTELFQIAYALYFVNFILIGGLLYLKAARLSFHRFSFVCAYGFFLSYLCYFFLPAIGPRFTLHDFSALRQDLPGLWLTPILRAIMDFGDSIPMGASKELAAALTQRDAFPSGHTMMAVVAIFMSYKYRISLRHFVAVSSGLLIIGTVYLRYHYAIDLVAGALLAIICLVTWRAIYAFILRKSLPKSCLDVKR